MPTFKDFRVGQLVRWATLTEPAPWPRELPDGGKLLRSDCYGIVTERERSPRPYIRVFWENEHEGVIFFDGTEPASVDGCYLEIVE